LIPELIPEPDSTSGANQHIKKRMRKKIRKENEK
jgi:hypothetical protein